MAATYDHEYPPADWTASEIERSLVASDGDLSIPTYEDAETWETLRSDPLTGPVVDEIVEAAADVRDEPIPSLPASLHLDYERTGNRPRYQSVEAERWERLSRFTLAECFERDGSYLDPVLDAAWAICEQSTWLLPAHLDDDGLPRPKPPAERRVALRSAMAARTLAELDYVLGDRLHDALRERIRREVDERVLTPYLSREEFNWLGGHNNWNAVCNGGTAVAALYLADADRAARAVEKAAHSLEAYLQGFDPDGCTPEGFGYWNYGVGNYVVLASTLTERTDGAYDLCSPPILERIARYPLRVGLSPGRYVPYSDECEDKSKSPFVACWLGDRFGIPALSARGRREFEDDPRQFMFPSTLRNLLWCRTAPDDVDTSPPRRDFLAGYDWWFARATPEDPDGLVVAAKGGHNGEPHNHNDCGTFVVHVRRESLLTDLGRHAYEADYFGERRYEYLATRSLGHSVPYVNGCEQATGSEYAARVLDRRESDARDAFALDLAGCYPDEAGLDALERTVELDRDPGIVRIEDDASFRSDAPETSFESVLVSYRAIERSDDGLVVDGEEGSARIAVDGAADVRIQRLEDAIDVSFTRNPEPKMRDVWRARIVAEETSLALAVDPRI